MMLAQYAPQKKGKGAVYGFYYFICGVGNSYLIISCAWLLISRRVDYRPVLQQVYISPSCVFLVWCDSGASWVCNVGSEIF